MKLSIGRGALLASVFALAVTGGAIAQPASPPPPPAADAAGPHHHHFDPAKMREHMADHLRAVLQLQPGQDAALNAFLDSVKPPDAMREHHDHDAATHQALTTPERLDKMAARMDERRARFNQVAAATKQFYAQLTPAQQKAFDSLPLGHEHGDKGGRWGHGQHGGMGGHEMGPDDQPHG
jgi:hypothetical protein